MKLNLAENIRTLRKAHGMTQEQLAEALGVTVGAVYKWEAGRSTPELELLAGMADLFEISIDALLGYAVRGQSRAESIRFLKEALHRHGNTDTLAEAETILQKYPNDFEVVYASSKLYHLIGIDTGDHALLRRALALYEHAGRLIGQNTDPDISAQLIAVETANVHLALGQTEKGLKLLKENNFQGANDAQIALLLIRQRDAEGAHYLSSAVLSLLERQILIVNGYLNREDISKEAQLDILRWLFASFDCFAQEQAPSFLDKSAAVFRFAAAMLYLHLSRREEALAQARQGLALARAFDENPDYSMARLRFLQLKKSASAHDDIGETAVQGIVNFVEAQNDPALTALWQEVQHEQV